MTIRSLPSVQQVQEIADQWGWFKHIMCIVVQQYFPHCKKFEQEFMRVECVGCPYLILIVLNIPCVFIIFILIVHN